MAKIKFYKDMFNSDFDLIDVESGISIEQAIQNYSPENPYRTELVPCYDPDTDTITYEPLTEDIEPSVLVTLNEGVLDLDYTIQSNDVITVVFLPTSAMTWDDVLQGFLQSLSGFAAGFGVGGWLGAGIGATLGFLGGMFGSWGQRNLREQNEAKGNITKESGRDVKKQADVRGAENQSITNNVYPFVMGKHLIVPFYVGAPVTEYVGQKGESAYISILYCAGYGPLKLTDFKLGDYLLAYNKEGVGGTNGTVLSGTLHGCSTNVADDGDILDIWKDNDISIEILQNTGGNINRGSIYPVTKIDKEINAQVLYIADDVVTETAMITYKGASFPTNFKTNNVYFTESYPRKFTVNMVAGNGLFMSRSHVQNNVSKVEYTSIPLWYCIQWRPYNKNNKTSDSTGADYSQWRNIEHFNNEDFGTLSKPLFQTYTEEERTRDIAAHLGNKITTTINSNFVGKKLINFEPLSGDDFVTEMKLTATVELSLKEDFEAIVSKDNSVKGIEVRFLRVSPNYLNETSSNTGSEYGSASFSDNIGVISITTETFDEEYYKDTGVAKPVYAVPKDSDYKNFCYIALRAKADLNGYVNQSLKKLSCIAESFSPTWDASTKEWLPRGVKKQIKHFGYYSKDGVDESRLSSLSYRDTIKDKRVNRDSTVYSVEVTEEEFLDARKNFLNWLPTKAGSNYADIMRGLLFTNLDSKGRYLLPEDCKKYNDNSSASGFMLGAIGCQDGIVARGYEDINLYSVGDWYEKIQALTDGSTDDDGNVVPVRMEANAYIHSNLKLEDLLGKIATTGRAVYTLDDQGKIKVIMDYPVDYPEGVINDQNCISAQDSYVYDENPAGFVMQFNDENDGYEKNSIYCWSDGNSYSDYKGQVVPYSVDYVTNPRQCWSLGRYLLGNKEVNKQVLTRKVGMEGATYSLGSVLLVQSDNLLIGDGSGRVQELIESGGTIYGFVSDSTIEFTGELAEDGKSKQGVSILQPKQYGNSKVVTLRLAPVGFYVDINNERYQQKKGVTNVILFDNPVKKHIDDDKFTSSITYNFSTGDICLFGEYKKIAAPYRIIKIKREQDDTYTQTLVRYDESIYNYGAKLPSFQSYRRTPDIPKDPISLSEVPSNILDLDKNNQGNTDIIYNEISKYYANRSINLYRRSTTLLTVDDLPKLPVVYNFAKDTVTPSPVDGWTYNYREALEGEGSMYFTSATALGNDLNYEILPEKWNPPIVFGANGANGTSGINGLTIFMEKSALTFDSLDNEGNVRAASIVNKVHVEIDGDPVPFSIGDVAAANPDVKGFNFSQSVEDVYIDVIEGKDMAKNGFIEIPINTKNVIEREFLTDETGAPYVDELGKTFGGFKLGNEDVGFRLYVSYAKAEMGIQGEQGKEGSEGPYYLGIFDSDPVETAETKYPAGCWYLNGTDGHVHVKNENELDLWYDLYLSYPEADKSGYYNDFRVKMAINDMFSLLEKLPENQQLIQAVTVWCKSLIASDAFVTNLSADSAFIDKLTANNAFVDNLIANDTFTTSLTANKAFIDKLGTKKLVLRGKEALFESENYKQNENGFRLLANGNVELNEAVLRGSLTSSNFTTDITVDDKKVIVKSGTGYKVNADTGYAEMNQLACSEEVSIPCIDIQQKKITLQQYGRIGVLLVIKQSEAQNLKYELDTLLEQSNAFSPYFNDPSSMKLFCFIASRDLNNPKVTENSFAGNAILRKTVNGVVEYSIIGDSRINHYTIEKERVIMRGDFVVEDSSLSPYLSVQYQSDAVEINAPHTIVTKLTSKMGRYYETVLKAEGSFSHSYAMATWYRALKSFNMELFDRLECYVRVQDGRQGSKDGYFRCLVVRSGFDEYKFYPDGVIYEPTLLTNNENVDFYIKSQLVTDILI